MNDALKLDLERRYRGRRLLVADDDPVNREVMTDMLGAAGIQVTTAADGEEAIALAATTRPHLILMDIHMPNLGGCEATAWLRSELGVTVPIIAMTASNDAEELTACLAQGMDDILTKPVQPSILYACLLQWLSAAQAPRS